MFKKGDIVIADIEDMSGIPMTVVDFSNTLRICACEYWIDDTVFWEEFSFDKLTVIVEVED